jgi:hypothetical protein
MCFRFLFLLEDSRKHSMYLHDSSAGIDVHGSIGNLLKIDYSNKKRRGFEALYVLCG